MTGIYIITSPTNKVYVGQSWDLDERKSDYRTLQCKGQTRIYNSLKKHGWKAHKFEIAIELRDDISQDTLDTWEWYFYDLYKANYKLLNLREPGSRGKLSEETKERLRGPRPHFRGKNNPRTGKPLSEETKKKLSESRKGVTAGEKHPMYGKTHTDEVKERLREAGKVLVGEKNPMFGRTHTPESRKKMSENLVGKYKGDKNPNYGREYSAEAKLRMSEAAKGRKVTQETKDKLSKTFTGMRVGDKHPMWGKHHSEESKRKTSESLKRIGHKPPADCLTGIKNGNFRGMVLVWIDGNLIEKFESIKAASNFTTVHPSNISKVLNGGKCSALQGYTFTREPLQK